MTPTILIFLKAPVAGKVKTRLAADVGPTRALAIYRWLVQRQLTALPGDWPVEVHFTPTSAESAMRTWVGVSAQRTFFPQMGTDLGGRLATATRAAFQRGAEGVLLIGGDCPGLGEPELREAARHLWANEVVMGPAADGGFYLLGLNQPRPAVFDHLEWGTERVAPRTRLITRHHRWRLRELPCLRDVDTAEDWAAVRQSVPSQLQPGDSPL